MGTKARERQRDGFSDPNCSTRDDRDAVRQQRRCWIEHHGGAGYPYADADVSFNGGAR
jgi:hypothetical protein